MRLAVLSLLPAWMVPTVASRARQGRRSRFQRSLASGGLPSGSLVSWKSRAAPSSGSVPSNSAEAPSQRSLPARQV